MVTIRSFSPFTTSPTNISINDGLWARCDYTAWDYGQITVSVKFKNPDKTIKQEFTVPFVAKGSWYMPFRSMNLCPILMYDPLTHKVPGLVAGDFVEVKCGGFTREWTVIQIVSKP